MRSGKKKHARPDTEERVEKKINDLELRNKIITTARREVVDSPKKVLTKGKLQYFYGAGR